MTAVLVFKPKSCGFYRERKLRWTRHLRRSTVVFDISGSYASSPTYSMIVTVTSDCLMGQGKWIMQHRLTTRAGQSQLI